MIHNRYEQLILFIYECNVETQVIIVQALKVVDSSLFAVHYILIHLICKTPNMTPPE